MKLKILFIASEFAPGMIPFAASIINTLAKCDKFEIHCICVNSGKATYRGLFTENVYINYIEYPQNKFIKLCYKFWPVSIINAIISEKRIFKPDIVHFLTGDFTLSFHMMLTKNKSNYYYTVHDLYPHEIILSSLITKIIFHIKNWGNKKWRNHIPNLTTSSQSQLIELKKIYPNKKIIFTPFPSLLTNSIELGNTIPKELIGITNYILFFGSVNLYKGVDILIEAYLNSNYLRKSKLVIAGKGLDYNINDSNIIRINRFIDDSEITLLFKNAKLIVYPYRTATMSGVLSLAYYFQKPVLASDISFFQDNKTLNMTLFKSNDKNDLQLKLEILLSKDYIQIDKESYSRTYGNEVLIEAYKSLYDIN